MTRPTNPPVLAALALSLAVLLIGCSSPPSRLYLLSSTETPTAKQADVTAAVSGSSQSPARRPVGRVIGVAVAVPEYLDRLDVVERTSANELKPIYGAQWGENLATTATRAMAGNLSAKLPSDDIVTLPSRTQRILTYQVSLDLTRFESDSEGNSALAGRWSIADGNGVERMSGRVQHSEVVAGPGYDAMAAAMSRNLGAVSAEIGAALRQLAAAEAAPPPPRSAERPRR
jgi:uncharacterized protein